MRRSSIWLQNGCLIAVPVLRLGIHPEMERPATLNRSMPSTTGATMSDPVFRIPTVSQSLDEEHNLHVREKVHLMESSFPRRFCASAHISGPVLIFQGQTCPLGRAFTKIELSNASSSYTLETCGQTKANPYQPNLKGRHHDYNNVCSLSVGVLLCLFLWNAIWSRGLRSDRGHGC
jgi:hypothetical protein